MRKLAVVTGAGSGIGRAVALELAQRDCDVILVGRRLAKLQETQSQCPRSICMPADITNPKDQDALAENVAALLGDRELVLVNAAGMAKFGEISSMDPAAVEEQLQTNLLAPVRLIQLLLPSMLARQSGHIVNVLSIVAERTFPGAGAYAASKAGLRMFGRVLAEEVRRQGVRVTAILPGAVDTPIWDDASFVPDRAKMLRPEAVAGVIADVVCSPPDRSFDEITLMPPHGVL